MPGLFCYTELEIRQWIAKPMVQSMVNGKVAVLASKISPQVLNALNADHLCEGEVLAIDMTKSGFNRDFIGRTCGLTSRQLERLHTRCMSLNISLLQYCEEAEIDC